MEYSIFPTQRSAEKWARENLRNGQWSMEVVTEPTWTQQYTVYVSGEFWLHYRVEAIL